MRELDAEIERLRMDAMFTLRWGDGADELSRKCRSRRSWLGGAVRRRLRERASETPDWAGLLFLLDG